MKWVFLLCVALMSAVLTQVLISKPRYASPCCFALGVVLFVGGPSLWMAPIPWPGWQGPVHGVEVSIIDGISLSLLLSSGAIRISALTKIAFGVFMLGLGISTFAGNLLMPALFYLWQLIRAVMLFVAVSRTSHSTKSAPIALVGGLGLGLIYEGILAAYQFKTGQPRPGGNLGHANLLGLASDFVVFPAFALLLGTRRFFWPALVLACGLLIALVGGSRATLGLSACGLLLTLIFALIRASTPRKVGFSIATVLLLLVSTPLMLWAANQRSSHVLASSDMERESMKEAARLIMADHPFGVGADQYVIVANTGGYSQRAGVPWNFSERSAPVHDTYYLIGAETGYIGLIGFVSLLGSFIILGFRKLGQKFDHENYELVPGLLATMIIVSVHIAYEWVFMNFEVHYLFAIAAGLLAGITFQSRNAIRGSVAGHALTSPALQSA